MLDPGSLVAREAELATLREAVDEAPRQSGFVVVEGERSFDLYLATSVTACGNVLAGCPKIRWPHEPIDLTPSRLRRHRGAHARVERW
jgi:hypothetical protein